LLSASLNRVRACPSDRRTDPPVKGGEAALTQKPKRRNREVRSYPNLDLVVRLAVAVISLLKLIIK